MLLCVLTNSSFAAVDIYDEISTAIRSGNAKEVSKYFNVLVNPLDCPVPSADDTK